MIKRRENEKKRQLGSSAFRAKVWDGTEKHAANMDAIGRAVDAAKMDNWNAYVDQALDIANSGRK